MKIRKIGLFLLGLILVSLVASCANKKIEMEVQETDISTERIAGSTVYPLPDTTMANLNDAILNVSLEEGSAYVDENGFMHMDLKIYSYDVYDMVDISGLKVGDTIVTHDGEVVVAALERDDRGTVRINGGIDAGGMDLVTDDTGVFYESGYSDIKNWHQVGEATIRVSADFVYHDNSDLDKGEVIFYSGSFLIGEVTDYYFTPHNTTIRVEAGLIVEMNRRYVP